MAASLAIAAGSIMEVKCAEAKIQYVWWTSCNSLVWGNGLAFDSPGFLIHTRKLLSLGCVVFLVLKSVVLLRAIDTICSQTL